MLKHLNPFFAVHMLDVEFYLEKPFTQVYPG